MQKPIKIDVLGHHASDYEIIQIRSSSSDPAAFIRLDFYNQSQNELTMKNNQLIKVTEDLKVKENEITNLRKDLESKQNEIENLRKD